MSLPSHVPYDDVFIHRGNYKQVVGELSPAAVAALPPNARSVLRKFAFRTWGGGPHSGC